MQLILCVWPELPLDQQYTVARLSNYITTNNARICVCFSAMPFRMSPSLVAPAGGAPPIPAASFDRWLARLRLKDGGRGLCEQGEAWTAWGQEEGAAG